VIYSWIVLLSISMDTMNNYTNSLHSIVCVCICGVGSGVLFLIWDVIMLGILICLVYVGALLVWQGVCHVSVREVR
jgi:NADH:ubiquinone oxidoreductase subunit 6 (subunit J)